MFSHFIKPFGPFDGLEVSKVAKGGATDTGEQLTLAGLILRDVIASQQREPSRLRSRIPQRCIVPSSLNCSLKTTF